MPAGRPPGLAPASLAALKAIERDPHVTTRELRKRFGISKNTVCKLRKQAGAAASWHADVIAASALRAAMLADPGAPASDMARRCGVSRQRVYQVRALLRENSGNVP